MNAKVLKKLLFRNKFTEMAAILEIGGALFFTAWFCKYYYSSRNNDPAEESTFVLTSGETVFSPIMLETKSATDNLVILYAEIDGEDITEKMQAFCEDSKSIIFQPDKELMQRITKLPCDEWTKLLIRYK